MNSADFLKQLASEHKAWLALLELLGEEENALVRGEVDRLATLSASKLQRLQEITRFVQARNDFLSANQYRPDRGGMEEWIAREGGGDAARLWQTLCECETRARKLHERIGILLDMRMGATRQALNVLLAAANSQGGYDRQGMAVGPSGGRILTSA